MILYLGLQLANFAEGLVDFYAGICCCFFVDISELPLFLFFCLLEMLGNLIESCTS